jgi:MFS superfamily sulfate permease-like transporter
MLSKHLSNKPLLDKYGFRFVDYLRIASAVIVFIGIIGAIGILSIIGQTSSALSATDATNSINIYLFYYLILDIALTAILTIVVLSISYILKNSINNHLMLIKLNEKFLNQDK